MLNRKIIRVLLIMTILAVTAPHAAFGYTPEEPKTTPKPVSSGLSPAAGFRPIGSPSRVDQFRGSKVSLGRPDPANPDAAFPTPSNFSGSISTPATANAVSQATFTQDGFAMPDFGDSGAPAPVTKPAAPPVRQPSAPPTGPASAPGNQNGRNTEPLVRGNAPNTTKRQSNPSSASDLTPVPTPQMNQQWSTTGNSPLVTSPSGYRAEFWDCGTPTVVPTGGSYVYAPPTVMPNSPQALAVPSYPGIRPLFTLGQENYNVQLGQGIVGQPTVYVPGQPFRNFFRYLSP